MFNLIVVSLTEKPSYLVTRMQKEATCVAELLEGIRLFLGSYFSGEGRTVSISPLLATLTAFFSYSHSIVSPEFRILVLTSPAAIVRWISSLLRRRRKQNLFGEETLGNGGSVMECEA